MNYPLVSEYIEAIKSAEDNFSTLTNLQPVLDDEGNPIMSSGNFAVVFKMKNGQTGKLHAVKCFLKEQKGRAEAYRMIAEELEYVNSTFLTPIKYLDKELFVDSKNSDETEFPVLLMDWVEGMTLDKYIRQHIDDQYELSLLAYQFSRLAIWLMPQPFAHGDLKPDNILVKEDGTLVLVDYDGMYVPVMKGRKARELGSPDFRHPSRTEEVFDDHIDDFSLANILLSLKAIALQPSLLEEHGASDRLLFSEKDYRNLSESKVMDALKPLMQDTELASLYSLYILALSQNNLSQVSFRLFNLKRPDKSQYKEESLSTEVTEDDLANAWTDEFGVMYSKDRKRLLGVYGSYLPDYEIPEGTIVICDDALNDIWKEIEGLTISGNIKIPSTVQYIGRNPFRGDYVKIECKSHYFLVENDALYTSDRKELITCFSKKSEFIIPEGVEIIRNFAFYDCEISKITIPASVSHIGENPFIETNVLNNKSLEIVCNSPFFFVKNDALYEKSPQKLISYFGKSSYVFVDEDTVTIGSYAFWYYSLKSIYLPLSIEEIAEEALYGTYPLQHLLIPLNTLNKYEKLLPNYSGELLEVDLSLITIDDYGTIYDEKNKRLLNGCDQKDYVINEGTKEIYHHAFSGCTVLTRLVIPTSIKIIGKEAFMGCSNLKSISIPNSVTYIGEGAFKYCDKLESIEFPNSITILEELLFDWCTNLTHVVIPSSVVRIGNWAFVNCKNLKSISIPNSVVTFGDSVFFGCDNLTTIIIPVGTIRKFEKLLPKYKDKLIENVEEEDLSTKVTDEDMANAWTDEFGAIYSIDKTRLLKVPYEKCLNEYKILDGTKVLGDQAFANNFILFNVHIPDTVTHIGWRVFWGCSNLTTVSLPSSATYIDCNAFEGCSQLFQIIVPFGTKKRFEELLPEYQAKLIEQIKGWTVKSTRPFDTEEIAAVDMADVVDGKYGLIVRFKMNAGDHAGDYTYIPLCEYSLLKAGDTIDMTTAKLIILSREGEKDICRVEA